MTAEDLKKLANSFFEWPTEDKSHVTTTSALLFAQHVLDMRAPAEFVKWLEAFVQVSALSGIGDDELAWTWPAPPTDPGFFDGYPQLTTGTLRRTFEALERQPVAREPLTPDPVAEVSRRAPGCINWLCDVIPGSGTKLYAARPDTVYTAADMASAAAKGFRDGVTTDAADTARLQWLVDNAGIESLSHIDDVRAAIDAEMAGE